MRILDDIVLKAALIDARRLASRGLSVEEAANLACIGAWSPYRADVERRLRDELASVARIEVEAA